MNLVILNKKELINFNGGDFIGVLFNIAAVIVLGSLLGVIAGFFIYLALPAMFYFLALVSPLIQCLIV